MTRVKIGDKVYRLRNIESLNFLSKKERLEFGFRDMNEFNRYLKTGKRPEWWWKK